MIDLLIVGCGAVVDRLYHGALRKLEASGIARVVALADPNPAQLATMRRRFRSARAFSTADEAFTHVRPTLTIIATPPGLHADHATLALRAGSHVLCEKPMATNVADAERMLAAARAADRVLAVGMIRRIYPCLGEARALMDSGAIGDRFRFHYREGAVYDWPVSSGAAFRRTISGGGVLADLGSHVIDFLSALFGPAKVADYSDDGQADGVETNCRLDLSFPRASGVVQLSWSQPLMSGLQIVGSAGELVLVPGRIDVVRWRRHGGEWETRVSTATWPCDLRTAGRRATPRTYYDCIYYQLVQALRGVAFAEPVAAGGEQGVAVVRVIEECYRTARPLPLPWLEAAERSRAEARHWSHKRWIA